MSRMTVYETFFYGDDSNGYMREYEHQADVVDLGCGAGQIPCMGCEADGPVPDGERDNDDLVCVECKDTGFVLVSI